MTQFYLHAVFALGLALAGFFLGPRAFLELGQAAAALTAWAGFVQLLDRRGLADRWAWVSLAVLQSAGLTWALAHAEVLDVAGWSVGLPLVYILRWRGDSIREISPLIGAFPILAAQSMGQPWIPAILQGAGAAALVALTTSRSSPAASDAPPAPVPLDPVPSAMPELLELRERHRQLRAQHEQVLARGARESDVAQLTETLLDPATGMDELAQAVQNLVHAQALTFVAAREGDRLFAIQASAGAADLGTRSWSLGSPAHEHRLLAQLERTLREDAPESPTFTVALRTATRLVGAVGIRMESEDAMHSAQDRIGSLAPLLASWLEQRLNLDSRIARTHQMTLLYELATVSLGAHTPRTILVRLTEVLAEALTAESVATFWLDGDALLPIATRGASLRLLESMSFARGQGVGGWIATGSPEILVQDTLDEPRIDPMAARRARLGTFVALPVQTETTVGVVAVGSSRTAALSSQDLDLLRLIADEASAALIRLEATHDRESGLVSPEAFHSAVTQTGGCMVVLEPLNREKFAAELPGALRAFSRTLRPSLPPGGLIVRQAERLLAFLPGLHEDAGRRWANEAAARASLVRALDPKQPIFAIRARVRSIEPEADDSNASGRNAGPQADPATLRGWFAQEAG